MSEQRQEAYLNLIRQLLDCANGEEGEILAANRLRNFGNQLAEYLNQSSSPRQLEDLSEEDLQAYCQFLIEILQATSESKGDVEVVYPLFAANTDKLDNIFAEILRRWATNIFEEVATDEVETDADQFAAAVIVEFGNLIQQFPLGNKASNMEIAIASYETVLKVFTQQAFAYEWAWTQYNLGNAYRSRIKGDKAQNIEKAIQFHNAALQVYTQRAFPYEWARTQYNLGDAYRSRIKGNRAQNVEKAIQFCKAALQVHTQQAFPKDWATTQNNLGNAYCYKIKGDKAQNIEKAIQFYNAALQVYTQQAFPYEWARTQYNLGNAYRSRNKGDRAQNVEKAIQFHNAALQVYTQQAFPDEWARTQKNLGIAYSQRIKGDKAQNSEKVIQSYNAALQVHTQQTFPYEWARTQKNLAIAYSYRIKGNKAENIEKAIQFCKAALQVLTQQALPQQWATTQNNLATAYRSRIKGNKAKNIEKAIQSYNAALQVLTQQAFPYEWARTQKNLAIAYSHRIKGNKAENIEKAIQSYNAALQVLTQQTFPYQWATTQNNLATAYRIRIKGNKAKNIEKAIQSYNAALQVRTQQAIPQYHAQTLYNVGILYQNEGRFNSAYNTYESAIATVELLRGEIISGEESKRKQAERWNRLYCNMVEVCLQLQEETLALEYIERSKTRNLVELMFNDELYPKGEIPTEVTQLLQQLRKEIAAEKQRLQQAEQNNLDINRSQLHQLRQRREDLISNIIGFKPIRFPEIQSLLDENTAIIEWYIFNDCFRAFIITRDCEKPIVWDSNKEDFYKLKNYWNLEYLQPYRENQKRWQYELNDKLPQLAEILHLDEVISLISQNCKKLVLIPHRYLHLLPIHALQLSNGEYLIDKFSDGVSYAPSCQLLRVSQQQLSKYKNASNLFAIQNPTNDLEFTDIEVETIAAKFNPSHILKHNQATQSNLSQPSNADNLKNANWLHFSCHGYFNLNNPLKSGLQLADTLVSPMPANTESSRLLKLSDGKAIDLEKCLTLENIFELTLSNCRLVSISACESGFTDFSNTSDEYIGLPSGFIRAGAASIVSSLWAVDDFSTAILMIKFYENIQNSNNNMSVALNHAQKWLRQVTQVDLLQWIDDNQNMTVDNKSKIKERLMQNYKPQQQPFKQPIFWAAFYAVGD